MSKESRKTPADMSRREDEYTGGSGRDDRGRDDRRGGGGDRGREPDRRDDRGRDYDRRDRRDGGERDRPSEPRLVSRAADQCCRRCGCCC
jgi:hypothetical protein